MIDEGNIEKKVINGGIIKEYGKNERMGDGEWMVVEEDEREGKLMKIKEDIEVVKNIEKENIEN